MDTMAQERNLNPRAPGLGVEASLPVHSTYGDDSSSAEEVERHDLGAARQRPQRPGFRTVQPRPALQNTAPWRMGEWRLCEPKAGSQYLTIPRPVWGFGLLALIDLVFNAAAGAVAAAVGAHGNGMPATVLVVRLGALAGVTKAAMTALCEILQMKRRKSICFDVILLSLSPPGICVVLAAEVCSIALGNSSCDLLPAIWDSAC